MARHKKMQPPEEDEPGLDISSLIDVCFLLLIYFLVTTQIVRKEQELSQTLPSNAPTDVQPELAPLFILIEGDGAISYKGDGGDIIEREPAGGGRDLNTLDEDLVQYKGHADTAGHKAMVQIKVDPEAKQQRVVDVLNALARRDIKNITFTAYSDDEVAE